MSNTKTFIDQRAQFEEGVRSVIASNYLPKEDQAEVLLNLECELRKESD